MPTKDKDIETNLDPAGTMRENFRQRQENELLRKECRQLDAKAQGRKRPNPEMVKALLAEAERNVETGSKIVEQQRSVIKGVGTRRPRLQPGTLRASHATKHAISPRTDA